MATFIETPRFPDDISYGSKTGPAFATSITEQDSGSEIRNQYWAYPRHQFDVAYGITTLDRLENLLYYFHVVAGRAMGFRYKDFFDFKSCAKASTISNLDSIIGVGTGALATFQLYKTYTQTPYTRLRKIIKPIASTVVVAVAGVAKTLNTHFTCSGTTGIITFTGGNIPGVAENVTAGFEFDVPVRFDVDSLSINIEDYNVGSTSVPLIELKSGDV